MYKKSARFFDLMHHFLDYTAACEKLDAIIQEVRPGARTLLDVPCGTGKHVEHLRGRYDTEGLDSNSVLLDIARQRCPEVQFHQGDMRDFQLGRSFDVVTNLFCAIGYAGPVEG